MPVPELAQRLARFGDEFSSGREFRYALLAPDGLDVLGEAGLYPRSATGRAPLSNATCIELGYWLRADLTGRGLVTEASRALIAVAESLPRLTHIEIRCDARNEPEAGLDPLTERAECRDPEAPRVCPDVDPHRAGCPA